MWMLRQSRRLPALSVLMAAAAVSLAAPALTTSAAASVGAAHPHAAAYSHGVRPNKTGSLDCNGFSGIQKPAKNNMGTRTRRSSS